MTLSSEEWDRQHAERNCAICGEKTGSIVFFDRGKAYHVGCIHATYRDLLAAAERALAFLEQLGYNGGGNTPAANLMRAIAKAKGV